MDLLEYQAKELFREWGIPTLPSQRIDQPSDVKDLCIPYPVVLKSQVRAGGRGKAGGIKFVANTIDAIAAASGIFSLSIMGEFPQVLLAEAQYDTDQEIYLAVVLDYQLGLPVLLGSAQGGVNVEKVVEQMQQVIIDQQFSSFYARRLAIKMGLTGHLITSVSQLVEKMYRLFIAKDLELVEINPLAVSSTGELMALDGKITVNDQAIDRHEDLIELATSNLQISDWRLGLGHWNILNLEGNVAVISNDHGLGLATLDSLYQAKTKPASYLTLPTNHLSTHLQEIVETLPADLDQVTQLQGLDVILINIVGSSEVAQTIQQVIIRYLQIRGESTSTGITAVDRTERPTASRSIRGRLGVAEQYRVRSKPLAVNRCPHFVLRLVSPEEVSPPEDLAPLPVVWVADLAAAITTTTTFTKGKK
jgi:succinyl-CoA synthetase beta subunit